MSKRYASASMRQLKIETIADLYVKLSPLGLVPPQALDFEESLLGACMIDKSAANRTIEVVGMRSLDDTPFYRDAHALIYDAMLRLYARSEPIDLLTVKNQLVADGKLEALGGPAYLLEITSKVVTTVNVKSYARVILEKYIARELIRICEEIKLRAFEGELDAFNLVAEAQDFLFALGAISRIGKSPRKMLDIGVEAMKAIESAQKSEGVIGIPMSNPTMQEYSGGYPIGDTTIIAARPSVGKSAFAGQDAIYAASQGHGVVIFALEMSAVSVYMRMLSAFTGIDHNRLRRGIEITDEEWKTIGANVSRISNLPIWIDDTPGISPMDIRSKLKHLKSRNPIIDTVFVDYIQLMSAGTETHNPNEKIGYISTSLKNIWKETQVAGIVLSQFSRDVEKQKRRPIKSDLRDSGSLEQDAADIYYLHAPGDTYDSSERMKIEHIRDKARHGRVGIVEMYFDKAHQRFSEQVELPNF
jgi:replicative DNA helicase